MSKWTVGQEPLGEVGTRWPSPHDLDGVNEQRLTARLGTLPGWGAYPQTLIQYISAGGRESHNSATPLVVGAFKFAVNAWSFAKVTPVFYFGGIAARSNPSTTVSLTLHCIDNGAQIGGVAFNSASPSEVINGPLVGSDTPAPGVLGNSNYYYEARIAKTGGTSEDSIELYRAYLLIYLQIKNS